MRRATLAFAAVLFAFSEAAVAGQTITTSEVETYFYADGEMNRSKGQFEITYYLDGDTITRTRVYDIAKKEVIPDNTVYQIVRHLLSDPTVNDSGLGPVVIRAIGQPGLDALEVLMIGETYVQAVKSTSDYFVISRQKRMK
jgi:hypothetical protein